MIDKMQEVGCTSIHIGIESGSQDVINKINKHISLEKSEELLAYMSQKNSSGNVFFYHRASL